VRKADRWLVEPLVSHAWQGYDIAFPKHRRGFDTAYYSIESERLNAAVRRALPAAHIMTGRRVLAASPTSADLDGETRVEAGGVIDARGAADLGHLELGWQKFVGQELQLRPARAGAPDRDGRDRRAA
jgi:lycopene beta-cyclase